MATGFESTPRRDGIPRLRRPMMLAVLFAAALLGLLATHGTVIALPDAPTMTTLSAPGGGSGHEGTSHEAGPVTHPLISDPAATHGDTCEGCASALQAMAMGCVLAVLLLAFAPDRLRRLTGASRPATGASPHGSRSGPSPLPHALSLHELCVSRT